MQALFAYLHKYFDIGALIMTKDTCQEFPKVWKFAKLLLSPLFQPFNVDCVNYNNMYQLLIIVKLKEKKKKNQYKHTRDTL